MRVSLHAGRRLKSRVGVSKKRHLQHAAHVWDAGLSPADLYGDLFDYALSLGRTAELRFFDRHVYVYGNDTLITVWRLPDQLLKSARRFPLPRFSCKR